MAFLYLLLLSAGLLLQGPVLANEKPNIFLWMVDDLSYRNFSFGGGPTPTRRLGKAAENGVSFAKAWSNAICRPTRGILMTGEYATKTGWWGQSHPLPTNLGKDFGTFGNLAKSQGYRTLIVGKWQLEGRIAQHGFDHYCLWQKSDGVGAKKLREDYVELANGTAFDPADRGGRAAQNRFWHPLVVRHLWPAQHEMLITTPDDFGPNLFAECVRDFLAVNKTVPFFIYWAGVLAHQHWDTVLESQAWSAMPKVEGTKIFNVLGREAEGTGSLASNLDYADRIAGYLKKLIRREGYYNNTIFVFTSDNASHGFGKGSLKSERGVHVPLIVWGGLVKKRGEVARLISLVDIYNTFSELMGAGIDSSRPNSYSWADYWTGKSNKVVRRWMIGYRGEENSEGVIEPDFTVRNSRFIRDGNNDLWDCSGGRDERDCSQVDPSDFESVYSKLGQKVTDIRENGFSDATIF